MAKQIIGAKATFVEGYNGPNTFAFQGNSPKGNRVVVEVDPAMVRKLAEFLRYTDSAGHAAWHLYSPEIPPPCSMCTQRPKLTNQIPDEQDKGYCRVLAEGSTCLTLNHYSGLFAAGRVSLEHADSIMLQQCGNCPEYIAKGAS